MRSEIAELLDSLDIQAWLDREGISYKETRGRNGTQLNVRECPCCGNRNWKVYLNQETGLGNCFVCNEKFSKWKFINSFLNSGPGVTIESIQDALKDQGWKSKKKAVNVSFRGNLIIPESLPIPIKGKNLKYLENRNITTELCQYFSLRLSLNGKFNYKEDGKKRVQNYAKRIIIPIFDLDSNLASFQGRDITGEAEKKYLFPPGFASTGSLIYNGQNARGVQHIVLGEGVFDVFAIKAALDSDPQLRDIVACGTFGKHLSFGDEQSQMAKLLTLQKEGLQVITIMWDGERLALLEAIRTGLMLRKHGFTARVALLPKDRDPNEVTAQQVLDAFRRAEVINAISATKLMVSKIYD